MVVVRVYSPREGSWEMDTTEVWYTVSALACDWKDPSR